jgi:hypothetical protein
MKIGLDLLDSIDDENTKRNIYDKRNDEEYVNKGLIIPKRLAKYVSFRDKNFSRYVRGLIVKDMRDYFDNTDDTSFIKVGNPEDDRIF